VARSGGVTLVELVVFIVIVGIAAFALVGSFGSLLPRSPTAAQLTQAMQLAQERMELILGQRDVQGYNNNNNTVDFDPCKRGGTLPDVCTNTFGYTVDSDGTAPSPTAPPAGPTIWDGNPIANYKIVAVTVKLSGITLAKQSAVLSNYFP
jgi:type II secretory pathway pseudopilin PulG